MGQRFVDGSPEQIEAHLASPDVHPNTVTTWCSSWRSRLNDVAVQNMMSSTPGRNIVFIFMLFELTNSRRMSGLLYHLYMIID